MLLSVSVIIPIFNGALTIERAVKSVLNQSRSALEIIIIDDHSSDTSIDIVRYLSSTSPIPVRLITNNANSGPGLARNRGWDSAVGDLVAFLDADDFWHPSKLEAQVAEMEKFPDLVMTCHERTVGTHLGWIDGTTTATQWRQYGFREFLVRNRCATPSVILRRTITERFSSELRLAEDYYLWLLVTARYGPTRFNSRALVHCENPAYGGGGLSGNLQAMYSSELRALQLLNQQDYLSRLKLIIFSGWSTMKFVVRLVDHFILRGRLQTVSESR
jgi:teichuronic acid biosynthesis glycosyltransferase TuaG